MKTIYIVCAEYGYFYNGERHIDVLRAFTSEETAKIYANKVKTSRPCTNFRFDYFDTYIGDIKLEEG